MLFLKSGRPRRPFGSWAVAPAVFKFIIACSQETASGPPLSHMSPVLILMLFPYEQPHYYLSAQAWVSVVYSLRFSD